MNFLYEILTINPQELTLSVFIVLGIIFSALNNKTFNKYSFVYALTAVIFTVFSTLFINISISSQTDFTLTSSNLFTVAMKSLILISTLFIIFLSRHFIKEIINKAYEYYVLILTGTLGGFLLIISNDFITAFVALEMLSLSCSLLTSIKRKEKSLEGGIKYLIQSTIASAIFLFGVSYIYGLSGSIHFSEINQFCMTGVPTFFYPALGLVLLSGIIFKLGCLPFTNYIPDIYEAAPYSVGAYISLIPKIAAFGFLIRIINYIFPSMPSISAMMIIISLISVFFASLGAIKQTNIKRLFGYSSILQSGFILAAISLTTVYSLSSVIFYILTYIFMNLGVWCAAYQFKLNTGSDLIEDYKGLYKKRPYFAAAYTICLVSLAGLPITSGFLGKLYLFSSIIKQGIEFAPVVLLLLCFSMLSIFAYFTVIKNIFISSSKLLTFNFKFSTADTLLYLCTIITIIICITPNSFINLSQIISYYIN